MCLIMTAVAIHEPISIGCILDDKGMVKIYVTTYTVFSLQCLNSFLVKWV